MTDKQPDPLALADEVDEVAKTFPDMAEVSACIRTQHAEIERLNSCLKWEQNRAERIGTHGPGCEKWGSAHFECALRAIERKDALLRQALDQLGKFSAIDICETQHHKKADQHSPIAQCPVAERFRVVWFAIKQELSK